MPELRKYFVFLRKNFFPCNFFKGFFFPTLLLWNVKCSNLNCCDAIKHFYGLWNGLAGKQRPVLFNVLGWSPCLDRVPKPSSTMKISKAQWSYLKKWNDYVSYLYLIWILLIDSAIPTSSASSASSATMLCAHFLLASRLPYCPLYSWLVVFPWDLAYYQCTAWSYFTSAFSDNQRKIEVHPQEQVIIFSEFLTCLFNCPSRLI